MGSKRWRRGAISAAAMLIVAVVLGAAALLISLPYFILSPGSAVAVTPYVEIPGDRQHLPDGDVMLTTVSVARAHPYNLLWAWLTPHTEIEKQETLIGDATPEQYFEANAVSMEESKTTATYVAMRRAGFDVQYLGDGALVQAVADDAPATGRLSQGDTIVSVNSRPVTRAGDVGTVVRPLPPGSAVQLEVLDDKGAKRAVDLVTGAHPQSPKESFVGVSVKTKNAHLDLPFPVELKTEKIGGPSAGLAFTLSALDELTPGNLTGGKDVATTGTIESDGSVGEVGGIEQKTRAVVESDIELFLVPEPEAAEARKYADDDLEIVGVSSLDEALNALAGRGGDLSGIPAPGVLPPEA